MAADGLSYLKDGYEVAKRHQANGSETSTTEAAEASNQYHRGEQQARWHGATAAKAASSPTAMASASIPTDVGPMTPRIEQQAQGVSNDTQSRTAPVRRSSLIFILSSFAALDERFDLESKVASAGTAVSDKLRAVDERYNVKDTVSNLAFKQTTGGLVAPVVLFAFDQGYAMAEDGLTYLQDEYGSAKRRQTTGNEDASYDDQSREMQSRRGEDTPYERHSRELQSRRRDSRRDAMASAVAAAAAASAVAASSAAAASAVAAAAASAAAAAAAAAVVLA